MIARRLRFKTSSPTQFVDITDKLREEVRKSGLRMGRIHLQSLHTTVGLAVNENEPLLLRDFESLLERLAPSGAGYEHDDFARRFEIALDEPVNGHAHCRQLLLTGFATLLVENGDLVLGRWQSVFAVELDGPRTRELAIQLDGDFEVRSRRSSALAAEVGRRAGGNVHVGTAADKELVELELNRQLLADPDPVAVPMRRLVEAGGKRLRPRLVQLTAHIGPRHDPLRAAALAAAVELLHNATLIHDDYVDESTHRRGRPTVAAAEGPERAIAVGDFYFAKATRLIAEIGNNDVTSTIADALEAICAAQIDDVALRGAYPGDHASYLKVVRGKTAALFAASCASGAQLSEATPDEVEALRRYGDLLGVAFQMADDMVDFSPSSGKPVGLDIRQRVLSLPLIYAAEDKEVGPEVRRLLAGSLGDAEVNRVTELVRSSDALKRVGDEARALVEGALHELETIELDGLRPTLVRLARSAVDRDS
ncbi:MAG TPA: secondary thiamine-phosphate synthase enzyme YjbQ [Candidatus Acidoferrum sp.]|jgi:secondary thiamine-phosphate synthase enzyme|nr:secondary thiamine-phosphate synthase enzyme YjbQ [Candidatus Acidoferrum sp.]